jgi:hypothetical protein
MRHIFTITLCLLVLINLSCQKEVIEAREYPRLTTHPTTNLSSTGAVFHGEVISLGKSPILEMGFVCDTLYWFGPLSDFKTIEPNNKTGKFKKEVEFQFKSGKTYHVVSFVKTADLLVFGNVVSFVAR